MKKPPATLAPKASSASRDQARELPQANGRENHGSFEKPPAPHRTAGPANGRHTGGLPPPIRRMVPGTRPENAKKRANTGTDREPNGKQRARNGKKPGKKVEEKPNETRSFSARLHGQHAVIAKYRPEADTFFRHFPRRRWGCLSKPVPGCFPPPRTAACSPGGDWTGRGGMRVRVDNHGA